MYRVEFEYIAVSIYRSIFRIHVLSKIKGSFG